MSNSFIVAIAGDPGKFADFMQQIRVNAAQPKISSPEHLGIAGEVKSLELPVESAFAFHDTNLGPSPTVNIKNNNGLSRA